MRDGVRRDDGGAARAGEHRDRGDEQRERGRDGQDAGQPGRERHRGEGGGDEREAPAELGGDYGDRYGNGKQTGDGEQRRRRRLEVVALCRSG